jgi:succinate dehydrogenase / fumarate reductase, cytochrome b subunit
MTNNRPLSPHLQIYKLPLTGLISITHRITGIFLTLGLISVLWLISQVKSGMLDYLAMQTLLQTLPARLLLVGFIYALMFHFCHGIRHLLWDFGRSFSRENLTRYAQIELGLSLILTVMTLAVLL